MFRRKVSVDAYTSLRRRLIRETEVALLYGLHFPERHVRIPAIEVGTAEFDPVQAERFWNHVLGIADAGEDLRSVMHVTLKSRRSAVRARASA